MRRNSSHKRTGSAEDTADKCNSIEVVCNLQEGLEVAGVADKLSTLRGLPLLGGILTVQL